MAKQAYYVIFHTLLRVGKWYVVTVLSQNKNKQHAMIANHRLNHTYASAQKNGRHLRQQLSQTAVAAGQLARRYAKPTAAVAGVAVGGFMVLNGIIGMAQVNRAPLFLRAGDITLSLRSTAEAKKHLASQDVPPLKLSLGGKLHEISPEDVGLRVDADATLREAKDKDGWGKFPLVQALGNMRRPARIVYAVDEKKLLAYLQALMPKESKPAVDALIVIPPELDRQAYITPEEDGYYYDAQKTLQRIIEQVENHERLTVVIEPQPIRPKVTAAELDGRLNRTNELLDAQLKLTGNGASLELKPEQIRALVKIVPDDNGLSAPVIDRGGIVGWLEGNAGVFYQAPTATTIYRVDGNESGRTEGVPGRALDIEATADASVQALYEGWPSREAVLAQVNPPITHSSSYSPTSDGLYALIRDFTRDHNGRYQVVVRELGGSGRAASWEENTAVVPASIFKVFLAYAAIHKIEQGQLTFDTETSHGTIDHCINRMIIVSDDACAIAISNYIGWEEVDSIIHAAGYTSTTLNNQHGGHKSSTANDIANIFTGLHASSIMSPSNSQYLQNLMHQQIYRRGIPAGSNGSAVADKVGILDAWTHDAGIVYSPKATYVLVVMTTNGGFGEIRELSQSIYDLYNR
jgi:beta-lactamase class A